LADILPFSHFQNFITSTPTFLTFDLCLVGGRLGELAANCAFARFAEVSRSLGVGTDSNVTALSAFI